MTAVRVRNRRGQGALLRQDIINAAGAVLAESGDPGQLSLRAVAKRAGIATTSVYLHFLDLDRLVLAVADHYFAELAQAQEAAAAETRNPFEALLARCRTYCRFGVEHPGQYRLMFRSELGPGMTFDFEDAPGKASFDALVRAVVACRSYLGIDDADPPQRVATWVWALEHGLVSLRISRPRFPWPPIETLVEDGVQRIVGSVGTGGPLIDPT